MGFVYSVNSQLELSQGCFPLHGAGRRAQPEPEVETLVANLHGSPARGILGQPFPYNIGIMIASTDRGEDKDAFLGRELQPTNFG